MSIVAPKTIEDKVLLDFTAYNYTTLFDLAERYKIPFVEMMSLLRKHNMHLGNKPFHRKHNEKQLAAHIAQISAERAGTPPEPCEVWPERPKLAPKMQPTRPFQPTSSFIKKDLSRFEANSAIHLASPAQRDEEIVKRHAPTVAKSVSQGDKEFYRKHDEFKHEEKRDIIEMYARLFETKVICKKYNVSTLELAKLVKSMKFMPRHATVPAKHAKNSEINKFNEYMLNQLMATSAD